MTEQPGYVLDEAVKLFGVLRRRIRDGGPARPRPEPGDVWGQATYEAPAPHIATGAPECQYCPVCRAIAAARTSGPGLTEQAMDAGRSLFTALQETLSAFDGPPQDTAARRERATPAPPRPREERPGPGADPTDSG
ncbi:hypothetical protein ACRYCC_29225 [Actinomadura scrupuli]|uniref:hypothetical protein n=1 Tax=Actinomadura scrupuli TaxID=559629 RepID=UPI003D9863F8